MVKQLLMMAHNPPSLLHSQRYQNLKIPNNDVKTIMPEREANFQLLSGKGIWKSLPRMHHRDSPTSSSQRFGRSQKSQPHVFTFLQSIFCTSTFSHGSVALTEALNHPDDVVRYSLLQFLREFPHTLWVEMVPKPCARTTGQPSLKRLSCLFLTASLITSLEQAGTLLTSHAFLNYISGGISYK